MSIFDGLPDIFTDALGEPVVYTPAGGAARTINAIFVQAPVEALSGYEAATDAAQKVLHARAIDVTDEPEGDEVTVGGVDYRIVTPIQPDGRGMIMLTLARA